jgi:ribonuclease PH
LALLDAGIAMTAYTSATTLSYCPLSKKVIHDPAYTELGSASVWTVACVRDKVVLMEAEGRVDGSVLARIIEEGVEGCIGVAAEMDRIVQGSAVEYFIYDLA